MTKRRFTKYPSNYIKSVTDFESYQSQCEAKKNNVLCIPDSNGRVKKYRFIRIDGQGDEYAPYEHNNWWTSYIVTPNNELLSWEFNGRYTPVDAVYGEDFWVEEDDEDEDEDENI